MTEIHYAPAYAGEKGVNGLGVAAVVVGILALLGSWVPVCGLMTIPLAIVGVVLGLVGVVVAMSGKRSGLGFPIAGTSVSAGAIVLALVSTGAGLMAANGAAQQANAAAVAAASANQGAAAATQPAVAAISLAQYERITNGMSYAQVVQIVGAEGTELANSTTPGGRTTKVYAWYRQVGDVSMTATFGDGKLVAKAQSGLE